MKRQKRFSLLFALLFIFFSSSLILFSYSEESKNSISIETTSSSSSSSSSQIPASTDTVSLSKEKQEVQQNEVYHSFTVKNNNPYDGMANGMDIEYSHMSSFDESSETSSSNHLSPSAIQDSNDTVVKVPALVNDGIVHNETGNDLTQGESRKDDNNENMDNDSKEGESKDSETETGDQKKKQKPYVSVQVSQALHKKYVFKPILISRNKIKYMNAQNIGYYHRELKNPSLVVWLFTAGVEPGVNRTSYGYTIKRLYEQAYEMNIQLKIIEVARLDLIVSEDGLTNILYNGVKVTKLPDAVLPRLAAKITYFGLAVVRQLEKMGVLVINDFNSLEISKDKLYTLQQLGAHNIPIPKTMIVRFPVNYSYIQEEFGYPLVLKKSSGSQGRGVMLVNDGDHLKDLVDMMDTSKSYILQEFISKSSGRDIRVIVIGGKAIGAMMRVARKGFRSNFHQGGYTKPVKLNQALEWLAINAASLIGLDIAGVDILIDKSTYRICEINSTPGFKGFELATGINVAKRIMGYVKFRAGSWEKPSVRHRQVVTIPVLAEHLTPNEKKPQ